MVCDRILKILQEDGFQGIPQRYGQYEVGFEGNSQGIIDVPVKAHNYLEAGLKAYRLVMSGGFHPMWPDPMGFRVTSIEWERI